MDYLIKRNIKLKNKSREYPPTKLTMLVQNERNGEGAKKMGLTDVMSANLLQYLRHKIVEDSFVTALLITLLLLLSCLIRPLSIESRNHTIHTRFPQTNGQQDTFFLLAICMRKRFYSNFSSESIDYVVSANTISISPTCAHAFSGCLLGKLIQIFCRSFSAKVVMTHRSRSCKVNPR